MHRSFAFGRRRIDCDDVTHRAIDSGSEFRLDEVPGVKKLDLDQEIQRISESTEDLKGLWLDGLPDELVLDAWTTDLEFARVMNKIRQSKAAMTFRVVWTNGVTLAELHGRTPTAILH